MYNNLTEEGLRAQAMQLQKEIEELETQGGSEPLDPEESMFELLRAAG